MAETKWTPGPWFVTTDTSGFEDGSELEITAPSRVGMVEIATISVGYCDSFQAEQVANANLITAAPELYAALAKIVAMEEGRGDGWWHNATAILAKARDE